MLIALLSLINLGCWLVFMLYWIATARKVKPTAEVKSNLRYVRWVIFVVAFLLLRFNAMAGHNLAPECYFADVDRL
jgi:hypothetical protein